LADIEKPPYKIVIKVYLYNGLADKEKQQLEILSKYAIVKMSKVYFIHNQDSTIPNEVLAMEYLEGVNAGMQEQANEEYLEFIANKIVDNLIAYHSVENEEGFGEIGAETFVKDWREYYRVKVDDIYEKAKKMLRNGKLNETIFEIIDKAYRVYDKIFYLPITKACLIHGDYNAWNVMLNKELTDVVAVINPFNCCWADPEIDLYKLSNANGVYFSLIERYKKKRQLSENFELKNSFYELFTEIMHYHDADIDIAKSNILRQAMYLKEQMLLHCI
jgi:fructosamine-3-kinase